jgi:chaperonin GroEL
MSNKIDRGAEAREKIIVGINEIADSIRITLGAKGKNVMIETYQGGVIFTNDGVTVARSIDFKDKLMSMGAGLVREAAAKTEEQAGDGTSTSSILLQAMIKEGQKHLSNGASPTYLKRGMQKACDKLVEIITADAIQIKHNSKEINQVATISANNDSKMGKLIADTIEKVGYDGIISVQDGSDNTTKVVIVEGAEYDRGFLTPYFANNESQDKAIMKDPYILVTDKPINSFRDIIPILDKINKERPLLLISDEIDPEVLRTIILNLSQSAINIVCIKAPEMGDMRIDALRDISTITGATYISEGMDMKLGEAVTMDMLGQCETIEVDADSTTFIGGFGDTDEINGLIEQVKTRIGDEEDAYRKSKLEQRLAKLVGGVAVIYVGAPTQSELEEKKFRLDDALSATRSAIEEGIIPGGGVQLLKCIPKLDKLRTSNADEKLGVTLVKEAIKEPFLQIITNADKPSQVVYNEVMKLESNYGYNVRTDKYVDMIKEGVVDPAKVAKCAIRNAVSIASMLLTTEVIISVETED